MASSSDNETNVNPTQVDSSDQPDELNQNTEPQNPGLNTRNTAQISASPTQHITSNTYVFTTPIKLTQSNFMLWKSQVISSIRANELEGFVDGSHVCPPKVFMSPGPNRTTITTPNPEYQIWRKQDHILLSWLLSSLSEGVLGTVVDCSTSCEVWTTLANQFGARTRARILYLRTQIQTTKKGSSTIHEYYSKMKTLLNSLRAAGNSMNDDDFIMCVLAGLGPEYDSVVTNINSMQESPSISEVYGMLLSQENRTEQNLSSGNIEANYAQMRNGRRSWNNSERAAHQQLPGIVFRNPGNNPTNNQTNQNPQDKGKGKAVADDNGSDPKGPCQIYWKMGHTAAECWHRFKKNFVPQPNRRREQRGAYVAAAEGQSSGAWYLDSGATNHVTNTLGNLSINSEYQESINNSSCPVSMLSFNSSNESVKVSVESNIADESSSNNLQAAEEIDVWHSRLGHPSTSVLKNTLLSCNQLKINKDIVPSFCSACQYGKQSKQSFKSTETKTKTALELIHTDLWGPAPILSTHGHRYYISFVDDKTRYTWLFPLVAKSQALETFITFKNQIEKQSNLTIKALQTDMRGEFKAFEPYLKREGITLRHSCPYLHEQNGKVERKHRHIVETGLTLLAQAKMPLKFWQEAFSYATFIINRLASPVLKNKTPFELLYSLKPDYTQIKIFGCECFPFLRPYNRHKFDFHTSKCILLGISSAHKGYVCMNNLGRIYISASVRFNEKSFPFENDSSFRKQESVKESDEVALLEKFQVVSFFVNSSHDLTQVATAHSNSPDTTGNTECIPSPIQNEIQQVNDTDTISEAVYMPQPEGFEDKNRPSYICKLEKALYGLRQAPRAWFDKLKGALSCWGFKNSKSDTSLFFRRIESKIVIMLIYVDDIIITGSDSQGIEEVIKDLNTSFALKDLGNLNFFLGIQVQRSQNSLLLSQVKYIQDLLTKTEMTDCKGIETPFSTSEKLKKGVGNKFHDPTLYRSVIGSLQYAVLTMPELAFSVNKLSQFMSDPRQPHWVACKRVLRYLKNTMNMCLSFKKSEHLDLIAYTDADWATDPDDRRSISGYCVYLGDNLVAWSSRKQGMVARSTAESEYRAMALCSTEITWINSLLGELKMEVENVPIILCDSTSAAAIAANPVYHSRTKHFEIDLHFLRDKVTKGELEINYIGSNDQIADVLTKPLPHHKFSCFRSKLKVIDKTLNLREGVENSSSEEAKIDLEAKLACHLSLCNLQPADMEDESRLLRWQNSCAEEYQHISMEQLNLLEF
ncbi:retrovirus-related pol polyprotein from transposon RE1 [Citrus sinensis]|nr:retrovirus-related pol polyprotein from transposon RE1 [Citrus sinensis]